MSYYDPLYPAYEATRHEIQRTIIDLEEKLRNRRELDSKIQRDLLERQAIQRQRQLIDYENIHQLRVENQLRESLRRLRTLEPLVPSALQSSYSTNVLQRKALEEDYAVRLEALRAERQRLNAGFSSGTQSIRGNTNYGNFISDDSVEVLVKKYQDGSKQSEYMRQLEASNGKLRNEGHENYQTHQKQDNIKQFEHTGGQNLRTPFDRLKLNETSDKNAFSGQKAGNLQQQLQDSKKQRSKKRLYDGEGEVGTQRDRSPLSRSGKKSDRSSVSQKRHRSSRSKGKKGEGARLDRSRCGDITQDALKKIENRLIVSTVAYEDSQYRNIKHQMSHLMSTYENELKMRKEIKDKINNHPDILRKHAMVTE